MAASSTSEESSYAELLALAPDYSIQLTEKQRLLARTGLQLESEELLRVSSQIEALERQRDVLKSNVESYTSLLSPMRLLPREVLGEVFFHVLEPIESGNPALIAQEAPLLLCYVCKWWKSVAYETPTLWARVHFVSPQRTYRGYPSDRRKQILERWLRRSGNLPLSISVTGHRFSSTIDVDDNEQTLAVSVLEPVASRWKDLSLINPSTETIRDLARFDAPKLESLSISATLRFGEMERNKALYNLLSSKPSLKKLRIPDISYGLAQVPIQWVNLTDLDTEINLTTTPRVLQMLQKMPQLRNLKIYLRYSQPSEHTPMVDMLFLQSLKVIERTTSNLNQPALQSHGFLPHIHAPNIRKLLYHHGAVRDYLGVTELCSDQLESINTTLPINMRKQLASFLKKLPSLKHLRLIERRKGSAAENDPQTPGRIFSAEIFRDFSEYCPNLESVHFHLTLREPDFSAADLAAITPFVEGKPSLKLIDIRFTQELSLATEEVLKELQAELKKTHPSLVFQLHLIQKVFNDDPKLGVEPLSYDKYQLD